MRTRMKKKPRCAVRDAQALRDAKVRALRSRDYRSVEMDLDGRIVVEVNADRYTATELFRRVWGPEWPVVRSEGFDERKPLNEQFEFHSREY